MKKSNVISWKNLPARLPWVSTAVAYLYLDKYNAPGWVWGMVITLFAILWILCLLAKALQNQVDILKDDAKYETKSRFQELIDDLRKRHNAGR